MSDDDLRELRKESEHKVKKWSKYISQYAGIDNIKKSFKRKQFQILILIDY